MVFDFSGLPDLDTLDSGSLRALLAQAQKLYDELEEQEPEDEESDEYEDWMNELDEIEDLMDEIEDRLEEEV